MQKQKQYTGAEVRAAEEQFTIKGYLDSSPDWCLIEYPIQSIQQNQLKSGDSIPDGVLRNFITGRRTWIEVTSVSRFLNDRKKIGLTRKGKLNENGKLQGTINLNTGEVYLKSAISNILMQKSEKTYEKFAKLAGLDSKGVLVIYLDLLDPFHSENEHLRICEDFRDGHVLFDLGMGKASFDNIFLLANVMLENGSWIQKVSPIVDWARMAYLKNLQSFKEERAQ